MALEGAQTTHLIATDIHAFEKINNPIYNILHLYVSAMLPVHYTVIERSQRHLVKCARLAEATSPLR